MTRVRVQEQKTKSSDFLGSYELCKMGVPTNNSKSRVISPESSEPIRVELSKMTSPALLNISNMHNFEE